MHNHLNVLHADDDAEDRWLFREGIREVDSSISLTQFEDGSSLLDYLVQDVSQAMTGHLIICDMQMPLVGGIRLLETIKQPGPWMDTPVIIFSTSSYERDIQECLSKGAAAFFTKPSTHSENLSVIRQMISRYSVKVSPLLSSAVPLTTG
jgi:CheY-like chemotaxis protein